MLNELLLCSNASIRGHGKEGKFWFCPDLVEKRNTAPDMEISIEFVTKPLFCILISLWAVWAEWYQKCLRTYIKCDNAKPCQILELVSRKKSRILSFWVWSFSYPRITRSWLHCPNHRCPKFWKGAFMKVDWHYSMQ